MLELKSVMERMQLIDPTGAAVEQAIEQRIDPLTGTVASVNAAFGEKARAFLAGTDEALLADLEQKSRAGCPFCSAAEKGTRYPASFAPEGQIRVGRSLAMPNLFSKARFDSVVIVDPAAHVLRPAQLAPESLASAILTAVEVLRRARLADPAMIHHLLGMNFLQPGGSSVPHPHFQLHIRGVPYSGLARLLARGAEFRAREGQSYWRALLEHERAAGARMVGRTGAVAWLAAWAPSHQREIWGLLPGVGSLLEMGDGAAADFASGISRVVSYYESIANHPFTLAFLSSPEPGRGGEHDLQVRICARPSLRALSANFDSWFAPLFTGDGAHVEAPEQYAEALRARF